VDHARKARVEVAGLVAGSRCGTADRKFLYEDLGIIECSHLPRDAGRHLPVAPRASDFRIGMDRFGNQRIDVIGSWTESEF